MVSIHNKISSKWRWPSPFLVWSMCVWESQCVNVFVAIFLIDGCVFVCVCGVCVCLFGFDEWYFVSYVCQNHIHASVVRRGLVIRLLWDVIFQSQNGSCLPISTNEFPSLSWNLGKSTNKFQVKAPATEHSTQNLCSCQPLSKTPPCCKPGRLCSSHDHLVRFSLLSIVKHLFPTQPLYCVCQGARQLLKIPALWMCVFHFLPFLHHTNLVKHQRPPSNYLQHQYADSCSNYLQPQAIASNAIQGS